MDKLRLATASCPFEVIILTETWLNATISNHEHFSDGYNIFRCDRTELTSDRDHGGGVLIAVNATLHTERIVIADSEQLEHVCVKIEIGASKVFIFAVYIRSMHEIEKCILFSDVVKKIPFPMLS